MALREFSEALDELQDVIPEGSYLRLCECARRLYNEKAAIDSQSHVTELRKTLFDQIDTLSRDNFALGEQLDALYIVTSRLRDRRRFYAKKTSALLAILKTLKVEETEIRKVYQRFGILDEVLDERKRPRDDDDLSAQHEESSSSVQDPA